MARKKKEAVNGLPDLDKYLEGRRTVERTKY
jgi:hypothetical protein